MALAIVRLGTPRLPDEGLRIGTVRHPPRGVPKTEFASQDWYDVWFPNLAPSNDTMKLGQAAETPAQWSAFCKQYKAERPLRPPGTIWRCWPPSPTPPTCRWAATASRSPAVIVPSCASC